MTLPTFTIAAVERDTGLSKDVLRMWERRYGFPVPERDVNGERLYPAEQVERLRLIKRLMDQGHRPGRLIAASDEELAGLTPRRPAAPATGSTNDAGVSPEDELGDMLQRIRRHDSAGYQQALQNRLVRQGLQRFIVDTVAPLTGRVGLAWEDGSFEVFEEHLFTELTSRVLRQAIATLTTTGAGPRVLLTTAPDEPHVIGLLMVEALLALEDATCIPLGTEVPLIEIARAAQAHRVDIVALSFSVAFAPRQIPGLLQQLRLLLPGDIEIWVGGGGVARLVAPDGVRRLAMLEDGLTAAAEWRDRKAMAAKPTAGG